MKKTFANVWILVKKWLYVYAFMLQQNCPFCVLLYLEELCYKGIVYTCRGDGLKCQLDWKGCAPKRISSLLGVNSSFLELTSFSEPQAHNSWKKVYIPSPRRLYMYVLFFFFYFFFLWNMYRLSLSWSWLEDKKRLSPL